jgi:DNA-binding protein H-NS
MTDYKSLTAEIARLQAQAEKLKQSEKSGIIAQARKAIEVYGISAAELGFGASATRGVATGGRRAAPAKSAPKAASNVGVAKYQDPKTGKTWTGRGKPPTWIAGAKDRSAFLIQAAPAATEPAVNGSKRGKAKAKAASTVGVPKYRDAATGKTWTGRGKPPLWIVGAANRADFLIKPQ